MPWQLVALATQLRMASALDDELDELDEEPADAHMFVSARRQLTVPLELELEPKLEDDPTGHVPHLAMMLSTAWSHLDLTGQPAANKTERTNPRKARFMSFLP